ncbi:MAG: MerR family DNA-binding transcriptional regulator, partial [Patescibacteria group bacterium]
MKKLPRADAVQAKTLPKRQGFQSVRGNSKITTTSKKINSDNEEFLTIAEAAQILRVSTKTLRRWEDRNVLVADRTIGGHRRYAFSEISALKRKKGRKRITDARVRQRIVKAPEVKTPFPSGPVSDSRESLTRGEAYEPTASFTKSFPQLYQSLHITQKRVFAVVIATFVLITGVFTISRIPGVKERLAQDVPNLVSPLIEKISTPLIVEEQVKKVLGIAINSQRFVVNVPSTFAENVTLEEDLAVNGGDITTTASTVNFVNSIATTLNIGGAATTVGIGAITGTTTVNNDLVVAGNIDVDGISNDIAGTLNLSGDTLTSTGDLTVDPGGGGVAIGTGTAGSVDLAGDDLYVTGDFEVDGSSYIPTLIIGGDTLTGLTGTGLQVSSNILEATLGTAIDSSEITDSTIAEVDLSATNAPTDNYTLTYDSASGGFTWISSTAGLWTDGGTITYLTSTTDDLAVGGTDSTSPFFFDVTTGNLTITGDLAVNGDDITSDGAILTINAGGAVDIQDAVTVDSLTTDIGGITIVAGQDLTIGTIGLNDIGTSNVTSGASLVGTFDEFANSSSANVQDVLDDLDAAIGSGASKWMQDTGFIYLTNSTDSVTVGGTTELAKLAVDGDADEVQLLIQGNSTQNADLLIIE